MRSVFVACLCAVLVLGTLTQASIQTEDGVLVLTPDNFDAAMSAHSFVVVEFYAPWCGHCKKLAPEWAKAAQKLAEDGSDIKLAKVDADEHKELGSRFGVRGFPTIKIFRSGEPSEYKGPRDADGIVRFVKKQTEPVVQTFASDDLAAAFVASRRADKVIVGYGQAASAALEKAANALRETFAVAVVPSSQSDGITLYRDFDDSEVSFSGPLAAEFDSQELVSWAKSLALPLFGELNAENAEMYVQRGLPLGVLFLDYSATGGKAPTAAEFASMAFVQALLPAARKHGHRSITFAFLDNARFGQHQKRLGLSGATPAFAIDDLHHDGRYPFLNAEMTAETVSAFVDAFVAGDLTPHMRSEEEPAPQTNPESVYVLVGKAFEREVFTSDRDTLVEFYAPWCGHCKQLAPIYDDLAVRFSKVADRIRVAKMDSTVNDPPKPIRVQGYPTLLFFKKGSREPLTFSGERTLEGLTKYILENNSFGITESDLAPVDDAKDEL